MGRRFREMTPRLFSRSGISVGSLSEALGWKADVFVQVGVGMHCEEAEIISGVWAIPREWVFGFEAHPRIHRKVQPLYPGTLEHIAVSDVKGMLTLFSKRHHMDGSSIYLPRDEAEVIDPVDVKSDTLDNLVNDRIPEGKNVLLWVDCEGNELKALEGARGLINKVDVINIEMTMRPPGDGWCDSVDVHNWLKQRGYLFQWIHTARVHAGQYDAIYVRQRLFDPQFCCCPQTIQEWRVWQAQKTI